MYDMIRRFPSNAGLFYPEAWGACFTYTQQVNYLNQKLEAQQVKLLELETRISVLELKP